MPSRRGWWKPAGEETKPGGAVDASLMQETSTRHPCVGSRVGEGLQAVVAGAPGGPAGGVCAPDAGPRGGLDCDPGDRCGAGWRLGCSAGGGERGRRAVRRSGLTGDHQPRFRSHAAGCGPSWSSGPRLTDHVDQKRPVGDVFSPTAGSVTPPTKTVARAWGRSAALCDERPHVVFATPSASTRGRLRGCGSRSGPPRREPLQWCQVPPTKGAKLVDQAGELRIGCLRSKNSGSPMASVFISSIWARKSGGGSLRSPSRASTSDVKYMTIV